MKHYSECSFNDIFTNVKTVSNNNIKYYNMEVALDTETTSIVFNGSKTGLCYIWMIGFKDTSEFIYYGRYLDELVDFLTNLKNYLRLSKKRRLVIYIQNLSFEFQFIKKYFEWDSIFAVDKRQPIKALTTDGIEFRDSLILSGYSLENIGKHLNYHNLDKKVGDLDYNKKRHPETTLTDKELGYCEADVRVLLAYINEELMRYKSIARLPITNTSRVRQDIRNSCLYYDVGKYSKQCEEWDKVVNKERIKYKNLMSELKLTFHEYLLARDVYQGGYTHGNILYINKTIKVGGEIKAIESDDFTSSYPYVMIAEKYPMSSPRPIKLNLELAKQYIHNEDFGFMSRVAFKNIKSIYYEECISYSKCLVIEKEVLNNGRVVSADYLETALNELDIDTLLKCYEFESVEFFDSYELKMQYLPTNFIKCVVDYYCKKTELKDVSGKEDEYMLNKGQLNSCYGMTVMSMCKPLIMLEDDLWITDTSLTDEEVFNKTQDNSQRFLYFLWGVWVSAYARHNLWTGIYACGDAFLYSDTDSIKYYVTDDNEAELQQYFNDYNSNVVEKLKKAADYHNIDFNRLQPNTIKGKQKIIGVWDKDGSYLAFKTLGAKRYLTMTKDHKLHLTCAGVGKKRGLQYMCKKAGAKKNGLMSVFDVFNFDLDIPAEETGKNTHFYNDDTMDLSFVDCNGKLGTFESRGGVFIESASFTLSPNKEWLNLIKMIFNGDVIASEYRKGI